jgi:hypothetical protein
VNVPSTTPFNPTGSGAALTGITQGQVGGLSTSLAAKARKAGRTFQVADYGAVAYSSQAAALAGTDSTAAIKAATDAAVAAGGGRVEFDAGFYRIGGALDTTRNGNAQIPLPVVDPTGAKIALSWYCREPAAAEPYPAGDGATSSTGAILVSTLVGQSFSVAHGVPSVVGGPTPESFGVNWSSMTILGFTNLYFKMHGIGVRIGANPTLTAFDLGGVVACCVDDGRADTTDVGTVVVTQPSSPHSLGLILPLANNNVFNSVRNFAVWGYYGGFTISEHTVADNLQCAYCYVAIVPSGQGGGHAASLGAVSIERCTYCVANVFPRLGLEGSAAALAVGVGAGPTSNFVIEHMDVENVDAADQWWFIRQHLHDPYNVLDGRISYSFSGGYQPGFLRLGGDNMILEDRRTQRRATVSATPRYTALAAATTGTIPMPANVYKLIPFDLNGTIVYIPAVEAAAYTLFSSAFTGSNSANTVPTPDVGSAMTAIGSGTWGIASNKLYQSAASAQYTGYVSDVGRADCTVRVSITLSAGAADCGLMLRAVDANNYLLFNYTSASGLAVFYKKVNGVFTGIDQTAPLALTLGNTFVFEAAMSGCSTIYSIDGVQRLAKNVATGLESATKHGVMDNFGNDSNGGSRFDSISITYP